MPNYPNGRWPESALVWFWAPNQYGRLERFRATPGTRDRVLAAIADAKATYGFDLYITSGPNVYRDLAQQWDARREHGLGAAWPSTSSHGGFWEGRVTLAADFGNAQQFINKYGRAEFNRLMKRHGLTAFLITRARGYAREEPWHVVDLAPFTMPALAVESATPIQEETTEEEDDMPKNVMHHTTHPKFKYEVSISNPGSGFHMRYVTNSPEYNNAMAEQYETGPSKEVSRSVFNVIEAACKALQPRADITVEVANADA